MDPAADHLARRSTYLLGRTRRMPLPTPFGRPAALNKDLAVRVREHHAGPVPNSADGLPGRLLGDLKLDAVHIRRAGP